MSNKTVLYRTSQFYLEYLFSQLTIIYDDEAPKDRNRSITIYSTWWKFGKYNGVARIFISDLFTSLFDLFDVDLSIKFTWHIVQLLQLSDCFSPASVVCRLYLVMSIHWNSNHTLYVASTSLTNNNDEDNTSN